MDLLNVPGLLLESYSTVILPSSPGFISSVDQLGAVQPQPALTFKIVNGSSPVLLKIIFFLCGPSSS